MGRREKTLFFSLESKKLESEEESPAERRKGRIGEAQEAGNRTESRLLVCVLGLPMGLEKLLLNRVRPGLG